MAFPPSLASGPLAITVVATVPTVLPTDATLAGSVFQVAGGNLVEIFGLCSANDASLYLFRNLSTSAGPGVEWYPVDLDANDTKKISVDATQPPGVVQGFFSGSWLAGDAREGSGGTYVVVQVGDATYDFLYASSRRV